jgi:signal transduction histidine kinase
MESIGRLAGGVAHDFNNLLTVINGYSELMLGELAASDPHRETLEQINNAGKRAAALTRQLLAFSRKQVMLLRPLNLDLVIGDMQSMLTRLIGEDVEVRIVLNAPRTVVRADRHQMEQVMLNLVANARDAMPWGGTLTVETAEVESASLPSPPCPEAVRCATVVVRDTGVGMDETTRQHVFEPFFTTKGVGKGTGLGLSMVQGIVAQSGGTIEVDSERGRGTTFRIYLPAVEEA